MKDVIKKYLTYPLAEGEICGRKYGKGEDFYFYELLKDISKFGLKVSCEYLIFSVPLSLTFPQSSHFIFTLSLYLPTARFLQFTYAYLKELI